MKASTAKHFSILALACCHCQSTSAFLSSSSRSLPSLSARHQPSCIEATSASLTTLLRAAAAIEEGESDDDSTGTGINGKDKASPSLIDDEEYVSPNQIKELRKEAAKRRARKKLTQFKLPEEECYGEFTEDSLTAICGLLARNELVEVRGISRDRKREVFATTEELGMALSLKGRFVSLVETKGYAATFYCPGDDDEVVGKKIVRRTSFKEGQWTKKPKPKRDNRGQIIKGEYEHFE